MSINEFCREAAEGFGSMREKVRRMSIDEFCREAAEGSGSMQEKVCRMSIDEFCREAAEDPLRCRAVVKCGISSCPATALSI